MFVILFTFICDNILYFVNLYIYVYTHIINFICNIRKTRRNPEYVQK